MRFTVNGKSFEVSQFTWGQFREMQRTSGIAMGDRLTMDQVHEVVKHGCKCQDIELTEDEIDAAPFHVVQGIFLEMVRQGDALGTNPTGPSSTP